MRITGSRMLLRCSWVCELRAAAGLASPEPEASAEICVGSLSKTKNGRTSVLLSTLRHLMTARKMQIDSYFAM